MTVKELIEELKKVTNPEWNVFIPVMGANHCNVMTKVKEDSGYYEELIVLKTEED
jgi:hypothetical protein